MRNNTLWLLMFLFLSSFAAGDTITLKDGTTRSGTLVSIKAKSISFREGSKTHLYLKTDIQSIDFDGKGSSVPASATSASRLGAGTREVTLPAGTEITVMANQEIDSKTADEGQVFPADVAENVSNASGQVVIPKGAEAELIIRQVKSAGAVTGSSDLALDLQSIKVGGRRYTVSTEDVEQKGREAWAETRERPKWLVAGQQSEP